MNLYKKLTEIVSESILFNDNKTLIKYSIDKWHASALPDVVILVENEKQISLILLFANKNKIPVYTRGAGVGYVGGCVPVCGGIVLSVERMTQILEINTEDGVAVVEPGVITNDLQTAAKKRNWYYPPDPASLKECSIGGNVATNAGGPRCLKYGVTKNYVLGMTVVTGSGEIVKIGGRCHKNKTGFDLTHLFCGSEGMLGVITKVIVRLIPDPESRAMLGASFVDFETAAAAVQIILNNKFLPSALEITDKFTLEAARDYLGKEKLPKGNAYLMVEIDGHLKTIENELLMLKNILKEAQCLEINEAKNEEECDKIWQLRRDFSYSLKHTGLTKLNEDVVVPRSKLVDLVKFTERLQNRINIPIACFGHAGDGNIHVNLMVEDYTDPSTKRKADEALHTLFNWIIENDGQITGEHGVGIAKKPWIKAALGKESFEMHQQIKKALDPNNILNPGKFLDH